MFGYYPELEDKYKDYNITTTNKMSDDAVKKLAKLFVELVAKYDNIE